MRLDKWSPKQALGDWNSWLWPLRKNFLDHIKNISYYILDPNSFFILFVSGISFTKIKLSRTQFDLVVKIIDEMHVQNKQTL